MEIMRPKSASGQAVIEWRSTPLARSISYVVVGLCAFIAIPSIVDAIWGSSGGSVGISTFIICGGLGSFAYLAGLRPAIVATPSGIIVRNPLRTRLFAWADVTNVSPGYSGLRIEQQSGTVTAWAVQKTNLSIALNRRTRADDIAKQLTELAQSRGAKLGRVSERERSAEARHRAQLFRRALAAAYSFSLAAWLAYWVWHR